MTFDLPAVLKEWRGHLELTQEQAAELLTTPVKTYRNYEQGARTPRGLARNALLQKLRETDPKISKSLPG